MSLIWLAASEIAKGGNNMLRRLKHSKIEVVAPEEEEDKWCLYQQLHNY
jgi:IS1 family transposase